MPKPRDKEKDHQYGREYRRTHKKQTAEKQRRWYLKNRVELAEKRRRRLMVSKYGMSIEDVDKMIASCNGVCAICGEENIYGAKLCVDHDHKTGVVRGLLCYNCNLAIGNIKDNIKIAWNIIDYLSSNNMLQKT